MKTFKACVYIFLFIFLNLLIIEASLHILNKFKTDTIFNKELPAWITERLWYEFSHGNLNDPFTPPYKVFSNSDWRSPKRQKQIVNHYLTNYRGKKPNETYNFAIGKNFKYSLSFNRYGFRKNSNHIILPDNTKETKNILALGEYATFGLGVENSSTYSSQLENSLNNYYKNKKFSVRNAGKLTASSSVGYSLLNHYLNKIKVNYVIWEFGAIDSVLSDKDDYLPILLLFGTKELHFKISKIIYKYRSILLKSLIIKGIFNNIYYSSHTSELRNRINQRNQSLKILKEVNKICQKRKIPLIILHSDSIEKLYKKSFLDSLNLHTEPISFTQIFQSDIKEKQLVNKKPKSNLSTLLQTYKNKIHPNELGHKTIANKIFQDIKRLEIIKERNLINSK